MAAVLNATMPFFTVILAAFFLSDEKMNRFKLLGVLIGIFGTAILIGPNLQSGTMSVLGQLAALLATFLYCGLKCLCPPFKKVGSVTHYDRHGSGYDGGSYVIARNACYGTALDSPHATHGDHLRPFWHYDPINRYVLYSVFQAY